MTSSLLEFGVFDTWAKPPEHEEVADTFDRHIALAKTAEALGYSHYFFIEHQNAPFEVVSAPTVYLAALARETTTIRIGAMIFQVPLHHPIRLAQDTALIDQLSRGRFEFAIGYGTRTGEFSPWNMSYADRREIGTEAVEVMLQAWSNSRVDYKGKHWTFEGALPQPQTFQKPRPRVWVGAHSKTSFDYAVENGFAAAQNMDVERLIAEKFDYYREAWRKRNAPSPIPKTLCARHVHVARTDEEARREAEPHMLEGLIGKQGVERALNLKKEEATPEMIEIARVYLETSRSFDFWIDEGLAFIGSPETVMRQIRRQQQRCGYDILLLNHMFERMPSDLMMKSLRLFGETVLQDYNDTVAA